MQVPAWFLAASAASETDKVTLIPVQASEIATQVDTLFFSIFGLQMLIIVIVFILVVVFAIRYRHGSEQKRNYDISKRLAARFELSWTLPVLLAFIVLYIWAGGLYVTMYSPPAEGDAIKINGIAKQWMWKFEHADGTREINTLHVPVGRQINVTVTSQDVIHSLYLPAFRIKHDVLPDQYTTLWFEPNRVGEYHLFCAEFCGTDHSRMGGKIYVLEQTDFEEWLGSQTAVNSPAVQGAALYRSYGCSGCHEGRGNVRAPSLSGLYGRPVPLANGSTRIADAAYIRDSILLPRKDVVASYAPVMPSFQGQISESDLLHIIAWIKTLTTENEDQRP